jgi:ParB-like chromosome segregation protein Spo0J
MGKYGRVRAGGDKKMRVSEVLDVQICDISVHERIRKDIGDVAAFAKGINEQGLIHPITVMRKTDAKYQLIAGLRRLEAVKTLGWSHIRATVVDPMNADEMLMMEIAENEQRKGLALEERLEYASKIDIVEAEKARERMSKFAAKRCSEVGAEELSGDNEGVAKRPHPSESEIGRRRDIVAQKAGFSSATQMRRAMNIAEHRPELLEKIDAGETTIYSAYQQIGAELEAAYLTDPAIENAPSKPSVRRASAQLTAEEKSRLEQYEGALVETESVEAAVIEAFSPASAGASIEEHEQMMDTPLYAALYEHDHKAVISANTAIGSMRFRCENDAKRIRAYEENQQYMLRRIKSLEDEIAGLRGGETEASE